MPSHGHAGAAAALCGLVMRMGSGGALIGCHVPSRPILVEPLRDRIPCNGRCSERAAAHASAVFPSPRVGSGGNCNCNHYPALTAAFARTCPTSPAPLFVEQKAVSKTSAAGGGHRCLYSIGTNNCGCIDGGTKSKCESNDLRPDQCRQGLWLVFNTVSLPCVLRSFSLCCCCCCCC